MYAEQTVEIPPSRRLTIDVPPEVPAGRVVLEFRPVAAEPKPAAGKSCPICAIYADPVTGEPRFNAGTIAAFEEGDAMERGEIPANRYHSVDEIWKELGL
ncbi:MAG: hypothetical protein LBT00_01570 [Spirochaetaceae bacterium]|jgi:hypothetical protein|nr:hypothetical protein [Spirochaetaceae bacterium]